MYKKLIEGKKGVIFDLDGTIADTEVIWYAAFHNTVLKFEVQNPAIDYIYKEKGTTVTEKWKKIMENKGIKTQLGIPELVQTTYQAFVELLEKTPLEPREGFWRLAFELKTNKNFKMGLNTNTRKDIAQRILSKLKIQNTFDIYVFGDEIKNPKPHPEIYKKTAQLMNLKEKELLVFEDSVTGATASVTAGMDTIVIWDGQPDKTSYPDQVLEFFPDFTVLPNNLDHTYEEAYRQYAEDFKARKKDQPKTEEEVIQ